MSRDAGAVVAKSHQPSAWDVFDASVWLAGIAVGAWRAAEGTRASVFAAIFGLFCVFRLASAISLAGLSEISATDTHLRGRIAGLLWVSRTAATGLVFASWSVAALALYPHGLGIVLGAIGLLMGQGFLIVDVRLVRDWRRVGVVSLSQAHDDRGS